MKHSVILLCGIPRSGTTWIGKIFDSHPDTLYRHEPDSGKVLGSVPLVAPIADVEKYRDVSRPIRIAFLRRRSTDRLEPKKTGDTLWLGKHAPILRFAGRHLRGTNESLLFLHWSKVTRRRNINTLFITS